MKNVIKVLLILIAIPVAIGAAIHFTGNTFNVMVAVFKPSGTFEAEEKGPAPDYAQTSSWAALPTLDDPSDLVPVGLEARHSEARHGEAQVDVFFIHPTGFLKGVAWNSRLDPQSATEENTKWMLANQASAFNGCCDIYAPRYREANIFAYLSGDKERLIKALDFAYQDVERAFDYFLENHSKGRPFIIASHSQGTQHGLTLLKKRISGTELRERMVAAYLIGAEVKREEVEEIEDVAPCDGPDTLHCINHWSTYGEGGSAVGIALTEGTDLCTNPLTWRGEGSFAEASAHKGAVSFSGHYSGEIWGDDVAIGASFEPHEAIMKNRTWAECREGLLIVEDQDDDFFGPAPVMPPKNYHGYDYGLFYLDIRENASLRVQTYQAAQAGLNQEQPDTPLVPVEPTD